MDDASTTNADTGGDRQVRDPPHLAVQQGKPDRQVRGAGGVRGGNDPAPSGPTRTRVLVAAAGGHNESTIATMVQRNRKTVQEHISALLVAGALRRVGPGKYARGHVYETVLAAGGAGSDRSPPAPATAPWRLTSGARTFQLRHAPKGLANEWPGFLQSKPTGTNGWRLDHLVRWTFDSRSHDILVMQARKTDRWSLKLSKVRPAPLLEAIAPGVKDHELAFDQYAVRVVDAWSSMAGVPVLLESVKRSRKVESLLLDVLPDGVKWFDHGGPTSADLSEPGQERSLEVRTAEHRQAIDALPAFEREMAKQMVDKTEEMRGFRRNLESVHTLLGEVVPVLGKLALGLADVAKIEVGRAMPSPAPQPSPPKPIKPIVQEFEFV